MKTTVVTLAVLLPCLQAVGQVENPVLTGSDVAQQLENLAEQQDGEPDDDYYLQSMVELRKHPLDLNQAGETDLQNLKLLSEIQIRYFLQYRKLLGNLLTVYELQAIPGWDVATIRKILPFVIVENTINHASLQQRVSQGQHSFLLRGQQVLEKSNGFLRPDSVLIRYPGSRQKMLFRYKYIFRNLLQFGLTGEKDPGEEFFTGSQKNGFDFYSIHLFARKLGPVRAFALGDFTVNLGQGLIQWQSMAFKKSADIGSVKRQGEVLRPYNSTGEYNFMRGAGITLGAGNFNVTAFASIRKTDGNLHFDTLSITEDFISSTLNSGYHRTVSELAKKGTITQTSYGGNLSFTAAGLHLGVNAVAFKFSVPLVRNILPYNQYAIQGRNWSNYSLDYSYTYRNFHFFGEAAGDRNNAKAFVGGLVASLDAKVDASVIYRNIESRYQSLYGNAFTENTAVTNENGFYTGITLKPVPSFKIDAYADIFSFPWLRYRVDAPSHGAEYMLQLSYHPSREFEWYTRFKHESKAGNLPGANTPFRQVFSRPKINWRTHLAYRFSCDVSIDQRIELVWFDNGEKDRGEQGFLLYVDGSYKPFNRRFTLNGRIQYFETDGFDSRLYAFENDILYSYSIPQFFGKGLRYYINGSCDLSKKITCWLRWSQTIFSNQPSIGSGLDKIDGNRRSEIKLQVLYIL